MSGITNKAESAASTAATDVEHAFESIPARLLTLGEHIKAAIAYPFTPDAVKSALPLLMTVITDMHQELAELRKAPCEGCGQSPSAIATGDGAGQASASTTGEASDAARAEAAPVITPNAIAAAPTLAQEMDAKWPTYDDKLAAATSGVMTHAEREAFEPIHAKVVAFAASLNS